MYLSYDYIVSLVDAGTISISDQLSDVIAYCVNASIAPVFYAIATWAIGYGVAKKVYVYSNATYFYMTRFIICMIAGFVTIPIALQTLIGKN